MASKNKALVPISVDVDVQQIKFIYDSLKPCTWVVNFRNGKSTSSNKHESFLDITKEDRLGIVAFRFLVDENKYTLTRKVESNYIDGFFYHLKQGRSTVFGKLGLDIPYFRERVGFCYDFLGNAVYLQIDHSAYLQEVARRIKKIEDMLMVPPNLLVNEEVKERYKKKIIKILKEPISYKMNVTYGHENIINARVAHQLFGNLERLPPEPKAMPRIYENTKEVVISPHGF